MIAIEILAQLALGVLAVVLITLGVVVPALNKRNGNKKKPKPAVPADTTTSTESSNNVH